MPKTALHASAQALGDTLEAHTASLSADERDELIALRASVDEALAAKEPAPELSGVVERVMANLEGSHPELTSALGVLAETLSELGI